MARMIPQAFPPDTVSVAERKLFQAMASNLDDDFTVIHSFPWLDDRQRFMQEGECDFLVLHPEKGMLSVETKSGGVEFDSQSQSWRRTDGSQLKKDPFKQAQASVHFLDSLLRRDVAGWQTASPPFGHAVVLPDADRVTGMLPAHVSAEILVLARELGHLQAKLEKALRHYRKPVSRLNRELFDRVVGRLLPQFQITRSLCSQFDDQKEALFRLTRQQVQTLLAMSDNRRLLVEGCAGSGKTALALEHAKRMSRDGAQVLLLCFNIPLANWMRTTLESEDPRIDVFHFHGLCEHVVRAASGEWIVPEEDKSRFWDDDAAELLDQALDGYFDRYDAIIVDEGQDFIQEWWIPIERLLADPTEGYLHIFHDPKQNIFARDNGFPFAEPSMRLKYNCRNTQQIAAFASRVGQVTCESAEFIVDGIQPIEHSVPSDEDERRETSRILHDLTEREGIAPSRIMIVGRHRFERSPYSGMSNLNGVPIIDESSGQASANGVRYATIYRFKGLETDCAILTGFSRPEPGTSAPELYVAASRAKLLLHVMYRE